tara:strand:- start:13722 stop:13886 length:165 start_codon:yes stop_codon:yes gene_type:complete
MISVNLWAITNGISPAEMVALPVLEARGILVDKPRISSDGVAYFPQNLSVPFVG